MEALTACAAAALAICDHVARPTRPDRRRRAAGLGEARRSFGHLALRGRGRACASRVAAKAPGRRPRSSPSPTGWSPGPAEDRSGAALAELLAEHGFDVVERAICADGEGEVAAALGRLDLRLRRSRRDDRRHRLRAARPHPGGDRRRPGQGGAGAGRGDALGQPARPAVPGRRRGDREPASCSTRRARPPGRSSASGPSSTCCPTPSPSWPATPIPTPTGAGEPISRPRPGAGPPPRRRGRPVRPSSPLAVEPYPAGRQQHAEALAEAGNRG